VRCWRRRSFIQAWARRSALQRIRCELRCQPLRLDAVERQRRQQHLDLRRGERRKPHAQQPARVERRVPGRHRRRQLVLAHPQHPSHRPLRSAGEERRQHLQGGIVGEVQVVQHEHAQPSVVPRIQAVFDRLAQTQHVEARRRRQAEAGDDTRQFRARPVGRHGAEARMQPTDDARQHRIGQLAIARPRLEHRHTTERHGEVAEQPGLAHARLALDKHGLALLAGTEQAFPFDLATYQARRTGNGHGRGRFGARREPP
jgi:hypothetical protein